MVILIEMEPKNEEINVNILFKLKLLDEGLKKNEVRPSKINFLSPNRQMNLKKEIDEFGINFELETPGNNNERKSTLTQQDLLFRKTTPGFASSNKKLATNSMQFDKILSSSIIN